MRDFDDRNAAATGGHGGRKPLNLPWPNLALFALTLCTTLFAGAYLANFDPDLRRFWIMLKHHPGLILDGLPFAVSLLAILVAHEFGHYLVSRHHRVRASLPYFLPGPNLLGTFGAVILMKSKIPNRNALFDIGAAGPLAGLMVTFFALGLGLYYAEPVCLYSSLSIEPDQTAVVFFPNLLLFLLLDYWPGLFDFGAAACPRPHLAVIHSPLLDAACVGFLVTAMNLLPVGQLDGGHITYAAMGERAKYAGAFSALLLVGLGFLWPPWLFLAALLILFMGRNRFEHPPPLDPHTPLSRDRKLLALLLIVIFVLILSPAPINIIEY